LSLQTAIISLNNFNQLIFVMVKCGVLFEVRTEFLNFILTSVVFKGLNASYQTKLIHRGLNKSGTKLHELPVLNACPSTLHIGVIGKRQYSFYTFLTSALDGGQWLASRPGRALSVGKDLRYPLDRRLDGPQSRSGQRG
jgi:hypothetical protein